MTKAIIVLAASALGAASLAVAGDDPGIAKVREAYAAAVSASDAAKLAAVYSEDGVEMPPNQPMVKGRAAIEALHRQLAATGDAKLTVTAMETVTSGSFAFDAGTYEQTIKLKTGQTVSDTGKYVVVLKKDGSGQWKVAYASYNSDLPPPPQPPPAPGK